ncbi:glycosyl transferase [Bacillus nitratireducens]|uniref:glycosyltransferase family 32 protein n=1 Tax=Bacillus nitratireducens TaxID=2026193 RepID=UPI001F56B0B1|nr:glycosyltransferase [Bacillus nitratireducens]UNP76362.1 glycosyl transferase [Bacillus nitratireducens]
MIPKIIHYCWFGGNPLPESAEKCIESWKKYCPDYEIIQWNETNYDVTKNRYMYEAYQNKKYGFVPDYARLDIVHTYGGIYLDTDVELIKSLDDLLKLDAFCGVEHNSKYVALGLGFGGNIENKTLRCMLDAYNTMSFIKDGEPDLTPAPKINTKALYSLGYNYKKSVFNCGELKVFPSEYFCPQDFETGKLTITPNTYSIHHYDSSWYSPVETYALEMKRKIPKILPKRFSGRMAHFIAQCKYNGISYAFKRTIKKMVAGTSLRGPR